MMKLRLLPLFMAFLCTFVNGQSTDLDRSFFSTKEVRLAQKFTENENRMYSVNVSQNITGVAVNTTDIYLNGFSRVDNNATYAFDLQLSQPIQYSSPEVIHRQEVNKDKNGNITSTRNFYKVIQKIEASGKCYLNGEHYSTFRHSESLATAEYSTSAMARENFLVQKITWEDNFKNTFQKEIYSQTNGHINKELGYSLRKSDVNLWYLGSEKHPEYVNHQTALKAIKEAFSKVEFDRIPSTLMTDLAPAISIFETQIKNYAEDNKKNKKVRYAAYYNLMKIYFHAEDLVNAEKYAQMLINNDYDEKDGKEMIESIETRKKLLAINKTNTSHFQVQNENRHLLNFRD